MIINSNSERTYYMLTALLKSKVPARTSYVVTAFNDGSAVISITSSNKHNATATIQILMTTVIDEHGDITGYHVSGANVTEYVDQIYDVGGALTKLLRDLAIITQKIR